MRRIAVLCLLAVSLLGGAVTPVRAVVTPQNRGLQGVHTVRVIVEDLSPAVQKAGLRKDYLQAIAEKQLKDSGITVLPAREPDKVPIVYIRLSSVVAGAEARALLSFYLNVQVRQLAILAQGQPPTCQGAPAPSHPPLLVSTWERGTMVMLDRAELFFYVQSVLTNLLGDLLEDYRGANG